MCGICGIIDSSGVDLSTAVDMNNRASHRGPDGEGYWLCSDPRIGGEFVSAADAARYRHRRETMILGHRRLAILDLSDSGLQPMSSRDGRIWIVFNGEIYNYIELRTELKSHGYSFSTGTDTEVILAAYQHWGTACFESFNGMWGMGIVDLDREKIVFSRDRLGIKPLYLGVFGTTLAFASEIKQFFSIPHAAARVNVDAVAEYIDTGYEVPPHTFFRDITAFPPGCWGETALARPTQPDPVPYWEPDKLEPLPISRDEAVDRVKALFCDAVRIRLRADVPVGVCLSGGLDSSSIFGQVQALKAGQGEPTYAFSAVYNSPVFDETPFISEVLKTHGGRGYRALTLPDSFLEDVDDFIYHHDEPPGILSQYAAWAVMRLAREHQVPVLLNGQGGDELFTGYWSAYYVYLSQMAKRNPLHVLMHIPGCLMPGGNRQLVTQLAPHFRQYRYRRKRDNRAFLHPQWQTRGYTLDRNWALEAQTLTPVAYKLNEIRWIHLPRLLKWDDRNSMAFSIEGRYPLLDYRLVELAVRLPTSFNLHRGWNKWLMRQGLAALMPQSVRWRKGKVGFETPQSEWIRTTLRPVLDEWRQNASPLFYEIVDRARFKDLSSALMSSGHVHKMDERHIFLMRMFFLDKWLSVFDLALG